MSELPRQFTSAQISEFHSRGLLKLSGVMPEAILVPLRNQLHSILEDAGATEGGRWLLEKTQTPAAFKLQSRLQKRLKKGSLEVIAALDREEILVAAEQLAEKPLSSFNQKPQLLFTPPNADAWQMPRKVWHVDIPRLGGDTCPGVQIFSFIDSVPEGGGGTIVATGSHGFVNNQGVVKSKEVKKRLIKAHPWFQGLFSPEGADRANYMEQKTRHGDFELQAVELTGEPGDLYLMDLRLSHSLTSNITDQPRLMVTQRYFCEALKNVFH